MTQKVIEQLNIDAELTEGALAEYFVREDEEIKTLLESEKSSLFEGGKIIRPFLTIEFCKLFGGDEKAALPFACAIEMIHTYSLIHDDLPCMDNDDTRRGKPTNHKVYGYPTALLAGDGLLTRAFGVAAANPYVSVKTALDAVRILSECSGEFGMVGGQIIDLEGESERISVEKLTKLHTMKTGALIRAAAIMGALAAGLAPDSPEVAATADYASKIGLAFQVIDDILDITASEESLGKPVGSDMCNNKTTFMTYFDIDVARSYATELTASAVSDISEYENSEILTDFAVYLLDRDR